MTRLIQVITLATVILWNFKGDAANCSLHFLFSVEQRFLNEHIWADYFHPADKARYSVFIHTGIPDKFVPPTKSHFTYTLIHGNHQNATRSDCNNRFHTMSQLLGKSVDINNKDDSHFYISSETIPIKSFAETYSKFCGLPSSSFCVSPPSRWINETVTSAAIPSPPNKTVTNDPWMILKTPDALKLIEKYSNELDSSSCLEESWGYHTLYGGLDVNDKTTWFSVDPTVDNMQGNCHTFHSELYSNKFKDLLNKTLVTNGVFINTPIQLLDDLQKSDEFYFIRKFQGHESSHHVIGYFIIGLFLLYLCYSCLCGFFSFTYALLAGLRFTCSG
jgi:hypothetical protein